MIYTILILLFIAGAGACNAVMDTVAIKGDYERSIFSRYSKYMMYKNESWRFKYKNGNPSEGRAFLGSLSILVAITDLWHFAQFFQLINIGIAITVTLTYKLTFLQALAFIPLTPIFYGIGFRILYRNLLLKKHSNSYINTFKEFFFNPVFTAVFIYPFVEIWYWQAIKFNAVLWNNLNELEVAELAD